MKIKSFSSHHSNRWIGKALRVFNDDNWFFFWWNRNGSRFQVERKSFPLYSVCDWRDIQWKFRTNYQRVICRRVFAFLQTRQFSSAVYRSHENCIVEQNFNSFHSLKKQNQVEAKFIQLTVDAWTGARSTFHHITANIYIIIYGKKKNELENRMHSTLFMLNIFHSVASIVTDKRQRFHFFFKTIANNIRMFGYSPNETYIGIETDTFTCGRKCSLWTFL